jgi:hypothetical protein
MFGLLNTPLPMDARLAGYLGKIVDLLLVRKTLEMINFINSQGVELFMLFAQHLESYSIMEIVKKIFQPVFGGSQSASTSSRLVLHVHCVCCS